MVNRTQAVVLGFFGVALGSLLVILVAAPVGPQRLLRASAEAGSRAIGSRLIAERRGRLRRTVPALASAATHGPA